MVLGIDSEPDQGEFESKEKKIEKKKSREQRSPACCVQG